MTEERRARTIRAARRAFREDGVEAVRLSDIAGSVGIARPNLYRYFGGKEELAKAVVLDEIE